MNDHIFLSDIELARLHKQSQHYAKFRDYEAEDTFISGMEDLAEIKFKQTVLVQNGRTLLLGLYIIFHGEADNGR